jgi:hypothetical protein
LAKYLEKTQKKMKEGNWFSLFLFFVPFF